MNSYEIDDMKLKRLVIIYKNNETNDDVKRILITTLLGLLSNYINEIGIYLIIGPRNVKKGDHELLGEYMERIQNIIRNRLEIDLFDNNQISQVKKCEKYLLDNQGILPKDKILDLTKIYYNVRKINVSDFASEEQNSSLMFASKDRLLPQYYFLKNKKHINDEKFFIIKKIEGNQNIVKKLWKGKSFSKKLFDTLIFYKLLEKTVKNEEYAINQGDKLRNLISYQNSLPDLLGYTILSVFIASLSLGIALLYECIIFPKLISVFSLLILTLMGLCFFMFFLYFGYFKKKD